jgi:tRNA uridine 5-carbamoylmethylation protein Kti12
VLIIEGCDGTGKTTLCTDLARDLRLRVGKRGVADRDKLYEVTREDTYRALGAAVSGRAPAQIWDRLFFSEPIYSRAIGRRNEFKLDEMQFIQSMLKALRCPIIFCIVPLETVEENIMKSKQMDGVEDHLPYIHGAYESVARSVEGAHIYDYRVKNAYHDLIQNVIKPYLVKRSDREWRS